MVSLVCSDFEQATIKNKNKINLNPKFKTERDMPILEEFYELLDKEAYTASTRKDMNFILDALSVYMHISVIFWLII